MTKGGRYYPDPLMEKDDVRGKAKVLAEEDTDEEDDQFLRQLKRTQASVMIWELLLASEKHRTALTKALSVLKVSMEITPEEISKVVLLEDGVFVNGKFCKNPNLTVAGDFSFSGLNIPGNTANRVGSNVTLVNVDVLPGLNTLGISLARLDYAPNGGLNPPHIHPRGTEILVVVEGTLHFNIAKTKAVAFAGLSSQNPGVITIADAIFGPDPPINPDVLAKAFQLDKDVVEKLQKLFENA
ncbi:hypothetical protein GH714_000794 [Hevea brasiliensis]|uniref:Cupin type-1 domain-containing protein n=1 Tax=Hevea brasiliensis TaxID=3981 RepID=A0A6A6KGD1_HEVBR|nr:hypothetical protein GH714_000794 [Hevea brasiliensis]